MVMLVKLKPEFNTYIIWFYVLLERQNPET